MITKTLSEQIKEALKKGDGVRVSTLRLLSNSIHNEEIAKQRELTKEEETGVVRRQLKQREEAIEALRQAQGKLTQGARATELEGRIEQETKEAGILKEFLPVQMSEEELSELVNRLIGELGASGPQDFGRVMGAVVARVKGKVDGKAIAEVVKKRLG